jgi:hypothetical protein
MKKLNTIASMNTNEILAYLDNEKIVRFENLQYISEYIIKNLANLDESVINQWNNHMFNDPESCYIHGMSLMETGEPQEGENYIYHAAKHHYSLANFFLADCYMFGTYGFHQSNDRAIPFYMQACKYGERPACQNVYRLLKEKHDKIKAIQIIGEEIGKGRFLLGLYIPFINRLLGKKEISKAKHDKIPS